MTTSQLTLFELAGKNPEVRFSPHCWKTRMAIAHKGLNAQRIPWRFHEKERIAFSGQGAVPVLVDGAQVIADSWRIALYLESAYPGRPPIFATPGAVPLSLFVNAWADATLLPAVARIILPDVFEQLHPDDRGYFRASREARFGATLEAIAVSRTEHVLQLHQLLAPLRETLRHQAFIAGDAPAYADYCVFGIFMWARCTSKLSIVQASDPVYVWRERLLNVFEGLARSAAISFD